jgi:hypothetical protein
VPQPQVLARLTAQRQAGRRRTGAQTSFSWWRSLGREKPDFTRRVPAGQKWIRQRRALARKTAAGARRARTGQADQRPVPPVVPVVPVEDEVPLVPVVVPPAVPLVPPVAPPHAPALLVEPVEPVVGVLPVVPVVGLPRSVMAPLPVPDDETPDDDAPDELAPEVLSVLPVDLQAARLRPIEAARMMLRVVRFILFSSVLVRGLHHAGARLRPP